jgi:putative iron-only hydrogenase system regulator
MDTRVAIVGIIVENLESAEALNGILHQYSEYIVGRMGIPYRPKKLSVISVIIDAPQDAISAVSGKIGRLPGVSVKTVYSHL